MKKLLFIMVFILGLAVITLAPTWNESISAAKQAAISSVAMTGSEVTHTFTQSAVRGFQVEVVDASDNLVGFRIAFEASGTDDAGNYFYQPAGSTYYEDPTHLYLESKSIYLKAANSTTAKIIVWGN